MSEKTNFAGIGRIPGDDEDSCYIFSVESVEEALEGFEKAIYEDANEDPEQMKQSHGATVFHTHILRSKAIIELV